MDGIEKIIERIFEEARLEAEKIDDQGARKAGEITERARAEAKEKRDAVLAEGAQNASRQKELKARVAELEARKNLLAARQEVIDEAFKAAIKQIESLPRPEYIALLAKLAARAAPSGRGEILLCAGVRGEIGQAVVNAANALIPGGALTLSEALCPGSGGLIVRCEDVDVNCSFDTLVRLSRASLSGEVSRVLFD